MTLLIYLEDLRENRAPCENAHSLYNRAGVPKYSDLAYSEAFAWNLSSCFLARSGQHPILTPLEAKFQRLMISRLTASGGMEPGLNKVTLWALDAKSLNCKHTV